MVKNLFSLFLCLGFILSKAQSTNPAPYCPGNHMNDYNMFKDLKVGNVLHSFGPMGNWTNTTPTYKYFDNVTLPNFEKNTTISITLNVFAVNDGEPEYFALWIDFNRNNIFENSEVVMQNSNTINGPLPTFGAPTAPITKNITIPANATVGETRMRLLRSQKDNPWVPYDPAFTVNSCPDVNQFAYGCTYDFKVNITGAQTPIVPPVPIPGAGAGPGSEPGESETDDNHEIKVYPNAVKTDFILKNHTGQSEVVIYDMQGRLMMQKMVTNEEKINISGLEEGTYVVRINNSAYKKSIKILKEL